MVSGIGLGGIATGFQRQEALNNQQNYEQGLLQLEQQRLQQQEKNQQRVQYMQLRSQAISDMQNTVTAVKNAHPDWSETQVLSFPALTHQRDMLSGFDKNLGLDPNGAQSILAGMVAGKSQIETEGALARAKEGPQRQALMASEIRRNNSTAAGNEILTGAGANPDSPAPGTGMGTGKRAFGDEELPAGATPAQSSGLITTPMSDNQKRIVEAAGMTGPTADFEAVKYAFGGDLPAARSKVGGYASNIIRSRGDQYWIDRGVDPQTANAIRVEFKAMQHGALKIADIDARMTTAVAKAQQTAQILTGETGQNLIGDVSRTKFKNLNDLIVAAKERTGNQSEIRLGIALETLASNYGVALGMGNSTLTDFQTQRAQKLLQQGWTKGQLNSAIDQLQKEMVREEAGSRMALKTYIGGMQSTMGTNPGQTPGQSNAPPPPPAGFNVLGQ